MHKKNKKNWIYKKHRSLSHNWSLSWTVTKQKLSFWRWTMSTIKLQSPTRASKSWYINQLKAVSGIWAQGGGQYTPQNFQFTIEALGTQLANFLIFPRFCLQLVGNASLIIEVACALGADSVRHPARIPNETNIDPDILLASGSLPARWIAADKGLGEFGGGRRAHEGRFPFHPKG